MMRFPLLSWTGSVAGAGRRWLLPLLLVALPSSVFAGEFPMAGQGSSSYKAKKDSMAAREDAISRAIADALAKALTSKVTRTQMEKFDTILQTQVYPTAKSFVERYEIVDEKNVDNTYSVVIKAYFDDDSLRANLDAVGFSMDVGSRRTVAVIIDEYFQNDLPPSNQPMVSRDSTTHSIDASYDHSVVADSAHAGQASSYDASSSAGSAAAAAAASASGRGGSAAASASAAASYQQSGVAASSSAEVSSSSFVAAEAADYNELYQHVTEYFPPAALSQPMTDPASAAAIGSRLLSRDVRLADAGMVSDIRTRIVGQDGLLLTALRDPTALSARAMSIGAGFGVDAIMVGTTFIVYDGEQGGRHQATASLAVRIVDTSTGDILGSAVQSIGGAAGDSRAAAMVAAQRLGTALGDQLGEQLFTYWKKRDEKGVEVSLRIVGVTSTRLTLALETALTGVEGASDVTQRAFDRTSGLAEYVVTTRRNLGEFRRDLLKALYTIPELANLEDESSVGTNWNFVAH